MNTEIWRVRRGVRVLRFLCVAVGLFQAGVAEPIYSADATVNQTKLLGVYPHSVPLVLRTASNAFAPSRDGSKVVCADADVAQLWDMTTGKKLLSMKHPEVVIGLAIAPDGKTLLTITTGREQPVRLWDLENGKMLREYPSPFRKVAETAAEKENKYGWNQWENPKIWVFSRSGYAPKTGLGFTSIAFSATGKEFATGSEDGVVNIWDTETGKEIARMVGKEERLRSVVFSPDGTRLLASGWNGRVALWDTKTKALVKQFEGTNGERDYIINSLPFFSDGKRFIVYNSYSSEKRAIVDAQTGEEVRRVLKDIKVGECIALLRGDKTLLFQQGHLLKLYDIDTGKATSHHLRKSGVNPGYFQPNVVYVMYLPDISAVMAVELENDENTKDQDWTTVSIVPVSEFKKGGGSL